MGWTHCPAIMLVEEYWTQDGIPLGYRPAFLYRHQCLSLTEHSLLCMQESGVIIDAVQLHVLPLILPAQAADVALPY